MARGVARSDGRTGIGRASCRSGGGVDSRAPGRPVGVSRSVFAERFTEMVGQPPMQYLALWRMQLAARLLTEGGQVAATLRPSATNRKQRSVGPSRSSLAKLRRHGGVKL